MGPHLEKPLTNNSGISIVEVVFTIGVIGIVSLLFLQWVNHFNQTSSSVKKNQTIENTMVRVSEAFGNEDRYCNFVLANYPGRGVLPDKNTANPNIVLNMGNLNGTSIPSIDFHREDGAVVANVIRRGAEVDKDKGLIVKDIVLAPVSAVDETTIIAKLEVIFQKKNAVGPSEIRRQFPVFATVTAGTNIIKSCSTSANSNISMRDLLCEIRGDGFEHYSEVDGKCVPNEGVDWFDGLQSAEEVSCPAGWVIATTSFNPALVLQFCSYTQTGPPPNTVPPRTYSSGAVSDQPYPAVRVSTDNPPTKCRYAYATAGDKAVVRPKIKCRKL